MQIEHGLWFCAEFSVLARVREVRCLALFPARMDLRAVHYCWTDRMAGDAVDSILATALDIGTASDPSEHLLPDGTCHTAHP